MTVIPGLLKERGLSPRKEGFPTLRINPRSWEKQPYLVQQTRHRKHLRTRNLRMCQPLPNWPQTPLGVLARLFLSERGAKSPLSWALFLPKVIKTDQKCPFRPSDRWENRKYPDSQKRSVLAKCNKVMASLVSFGYLSHSWHFLLQTRLKPGVRTDLPPPPVSLLGKKRGTTSDTLLSWECPNCKSEQKTLG